MRFNLNTKKVVTAAVIAAIYAVLTIAIAPLSYGMMQLRFSEAMTILPVFTPLAIPGLFIGCLLANLLSPVGFIDVVFGSLASLLSAYGTYKLRHKILLAPLPPVVVNGIIVGIMLKYYYGVDAHLLLCMLWVAGGQAVACYGLGLPLKKLLDKHKDIFA
ncbi:MAG: QueT transporter family protein [Clostridiales bacterium]|nr:QueT transporter family protein [Clostridiales bacterium]MDD7347897.1 QueT transporter family protein [Clostridiales bacterium]MDY4061271.1 QueT transporter family protein [Anaerovoracaceae bacterium]